jgi:hypothetical protein
MLKSALDRSITFLSKMANPKSVPTSTSEKQTQLAPHLKRSISLDKDRSSSDSLKAEIFFFKPIVQEPKTSQNKASIILRIPPLRTSSSERSICSPCPSPFLLGAPRCSAFSFVRQTADKRKSLDKNQEHCKSKVSKAKRKQNSASRKSVSRQILQHSPFQSNVSAETSSSGPKNLVRITRSKMRNTQVVLLDKTSEVAAVQRVTRSQSLRKISSLI